MINYTKYSKNIFRYAMMALAFVCLMSACRKTEFMPPPVGEPVAYADSSLTLSEFMKKSVAYSLFWQAWQRSNIEKVLKDYDPNYSFSLFLPDNTAMEAAGLNSDKIRNSPIPVLDSLMRLHIVPKKLYPEPLQTQVGNLELQSLLLNKNYLEPGQNDFNPDYGYRYRHYLAVKDGYIYINGQNMGAAANMRILKEASIFPINKVLKKPVKTIRQLLVEDGRFGMYLGIRRYNDSLYNAVTGVMETYLYRTPYDQRYVLGLYNYLRTEPMLDFLSTPNYYYDEFNEAFIESKTVYMTTILAPTDDAFKRAGFQRIEDLIALNERAIPYPDYEGSATLSGYLPTDSILMNHYWQSSSVTVHYGSVGNTNIEVAGIPKGLMILYSNDLRNEIMSDFKVRITEYGGKDFSKVNNLDFIRDGENVRARVKGSGAEPATFIQKDIEAFNGVIHVVDHLLLPPGFKLH